VKNEVVSLVLATNQEPAVVCILKLQLKTFLEFTRRHGAFCLVKTVAQNTDALEKCYFVQGLYLLVIAIVSFKYHIQFSTVRVCLNTRQCYWFCTKYKTFKVYNETSKHETCKQVHALKKYQGLLRALKSIC
jgi:hypothetical protein